MIWIAALNESALCSIVMTGAIPRIQAVALICRRLEEGRAAGMNLLDRLVLDLLVITKESGLDLLLRDFTELTSVTRGSGFVL
jgi:hypothetical protein